MFSLTVQNLMRNTFWVSGHQRCHHARVKTTSIHTDSYLGQCWMAENQNESVCRRPCSFESQCGGFQVSRENWRSKLVKTRERLWWCSDCLLAMDLGRGLVCSGSSWLQRAEVRSHTSLLQSQLSAVTLVAYRQRRWEYLHHKNLQTPYKTVLWGEPVRHSPARHCMYIFIFSKILSWELV